VGLIVIFFRDFIVTFFDFFLDIQLRFSYIQLIQKRVLIKLIKSKKISPVQVVSFKNSWAQIVAIHYEQKEFASEGA
jgi:hypothetical protein